MSGPDWILECDPGRLQIRLEEENQMLIAKDSGDDFPLAPTGTHRAICYSVADLGTQTSQYGARRQVLISWELSDCPMDDGRPFAVSKFYTLSLDERSNLRQDLEAWRSRPFNAGELKGFDISKLLGVSCMVIVMHKPRQDGRDSAVVHSVSALPRGMEKPILANPAYCFDLDEPSAVHDIAKLPDWVQKKVMSSPEWQKLAHPPGMTQPQAQAYQAQSQAMHTGMATAQQEAADDLDIPF